MKTELSYKPFYAKINRSDKANKDTAVGDYLDVIYPAYLEPFKYDQLQILEIGILEGGSLRMWRNYFINSNIYGLDVNPNSMFQEDRIKTYLGSQSDPEVLATLPGPFHIVIDDGSHVCTDQIFTFEHLFPLMPAGGLYFIEDIRLARKDNWNTSDTLTPYFTRLAADVATHRNAKICYVHFWRNMIVIRKED